MWVMGFFLKLFSMTAASIRNWEAIGWFVMFKKENPLTLQFQLHIVVTENLC